MSYPLIGGSFNNLQPKAPRRHRMSKIFTGGLNGLTNAPGASAPLTTLCMVPIEAPCLAARLLFANYRADITMTIASASIYPSDSYSQGIAMNNDRVGKGSGGQWHPVPTGGAPGSKVYFDNAGADVATINGAGTTRNITIGPVAANTGNVSWPYTYTYSDWIPVTSIPRVDGGVQHVLFVYVTVSSAAETVTLMNSGPFTDNVAQNRDRWLIGGTAWNNSTDYADNPTGTGFKGNGGTGCLIGVQYLTTTPGITIMMSGDSLSTTPTNDTYSTAIHRAAWDLSSPSMPIEVANLGWGSTGSLTYGPLYDNNIDGIQPSIVAHQPLSRNDGSGDAIQQLLLARVLARSQSALIKYGAPTIWNNAGCEPSYTVSSSIAGYQNIRNLMLVSSQNSGIGYIDAPAIIGQPGAEAQYISTLISDDNTHPNNAGVEACVPYVRKVLLGMIE